MRPLGYEKRRASAKSNRWARICGTWYVSHLVTRLHSWRLFPRVDMDPPPRYSCQGIRIATAVVGFQCQRQAVRLSGLR